MTATVGASFTILLFATSESLPTGEVAVTAILSTPVSPCKSISSPKLTLSFPSTTSNLLSPRYQPSFFFSSLIIWSLDRVILIILPTSFSNSKFFLISATFSLNSLSLKVTPLFFATRKIFSLICSSVGVRDPTVSPVDTNKYFSWLFSFLSPTILSVWISSTVGALGFRASI